jgi:hypothetical protein
VENSTTLTALHLNETAGAARGHDPSELHLRKMRSDNQIFAVGNFIGDAVSHKRCGDGVNVPNHVPVTFFYALGPRRMGDTWWRRRLPCSNLPRPPC